MHVIARLLRLSPAGTVALIGCYGAQPPPAQLPERPAGDIGAIIADELQPLVLEESDLVINVSIEVSVDPRGGFLVSDAAEAQFRRYDPDGHLEWARGARGQGPEEFQALSAVRRLADGRIAALERTNRLVLRDSLGDEVLAEFRTALYHASDAHAFDDSLLIVTGVLQNAHESPRLHLWSLPEGRITRSFFEPYQNVASRTAAVTAAWTNFDVLGTIVAAVYPVSDSVHLFEVDGTHIGALPLPSTSFRRVPAEEPGEITDPRRRAQWLQSFDLVADVHWVSSDTLLVVYQNVVAPQALGRQWHLLAIERSSGEALFELHDIPRPLAYDRVARLLVFDDPSSEVPNRWLTGRLR